MSNITEYLKQLETAKQIQQDANDRIVNLTKEYENKLKSCRERISQSNKAINKILTCDIKARMGDIVESLSEAWNTPVEEMQIFSDTRIGETWNKDMNLDNYIKGQLFFRLDLRESRPLSFLIQDSNGKHQTRISTFVNTTELQPDGKPLYEHMKLAIAPQVTSNGRYRIVVDIDNINDVILPFTINNLVAFDRDDKLQPVNDTAQAIIGASKKLDKQNQDTSSIQTYQVEQEVEDAYEDDPTYW
ncbi:MAG: hypothetical protein IJW59_01525 [Clostridia bacterium]|nr:hypothetical protein [Clostridia bacterium]